jgi:hypothetical protein
MPPLSRHVARCRTTSPARWIRRTSAIGWRAIAQVAHGRLRVSTGPGGATASSPRRLPDRARRHRAEYALAGFPPPGRSPGKPEPTRSRGGSRRRRGRGQLSRRSASRRSRCCRSWCAASRSARRDGLAPNGRLHAPHIELAELLARGRRHVRQRPPVRRASTPTATRSPGSRTARASGIASTMPWDGCAAAGSTRRSCSSTSTTST